MGLVASMAGHTVPRQCTQTHTQCCETYIRSMAGSLQTSRFTNVTQVAHTFPPLFLFASTGSVPCDSLLHTLPYSTLKRPI